MSTESLDFRSTMDSSAYHKALRDMSSGAQKTASGITSAFKDVGTKIGAASVGAGLLAIAKAGDDARSSLARINAATDDLGAASKVFADLKELASETGVAASESAGAFARFSIAARQIGASNEEVVQLIAGIQKAGIISGSTSTEVSAASQQIGQALASGRFQGDELRSVMENLPLLAEGLAKQLGVGIGELREMGKEGELTADRVFPALLKATAELETKFKEMPPTMQRAWDVFKNEGLNALAAIDERLGASKLAMLLLQGGSKALKSGALDGLLGLGGAAAAGGQLAASEAKAERARQEAAKDLKIPGLNAPLPDGLKPFTDPKAEKAAEQFNKEMERIAKDRIETEKDFNDGMRKLNEEIEEEQKRARERYDREVDRIRDGFDSLNKAIEDGTKEFRAALKGLTDAKRSELANALAGRNASLNAATQFGLLSPDDKRTQIRADRDFEREMARQKRIAEKGFIFDDKGKRRTADARSGAQRAGRGAAEVILADASIKAIRRELEILVNQE